jgi:hypothetical protein
VRLPARQPAQLPAVPAINTAALQEIADAEQFLVKNYRKVLASLVDKAKQGSVAAADIVRKIVGDYKADQIEQVRAKPSPTPPIIEAQLIQVSLNLGAKPESLTLTKPALEAMPEERRNDLLGKGVKVVEALPAPPVAEATVVEEPPNHTCAECGTEFFSKAMNAKVCRLCRKQMSMDKLLAAKEAARVERRSRAADTSERRSRHATP